MCRDLADALTTWETAQLTSTAAVALLHVGFARPDTVGVQALLETLTDGLYVTEATRHATPRECGVSGRIAGRCEGRDLPTQAVYRSIGLWFHVDMGNDVHSSSSRRTDKMHDESIVPPSEARGRAGWLAQLSEEDVETSALLEIAGVRSDEDYRGALDRLPGVARLRADSHRFRTLTRDIALDDPFAIAEYLPDWAYSAQLNALRLSQRCKNVFMNARLQTVSDVLSLGPFGVMELRNFGRTSLREFAARLSEFVIGVGGLESTKLARLVPDRPNDGDTSIAARFAPKTETGRTAPTPELPPEAPNLRAALDVSLRGLRERHARALRLWLGMDEPPKTLEDIGGVLGVTRERARQLRNRGSEQIREGWRWPAEMERRIEGLLSNRQEPLYLDLIAAEDKWFDGFQENLTALGRLIEDLAGDALHVWELNDRLIVTHCLEERWGDLMDAARGAIEREISVGITRSDARVLIGGVAVADGAPDLAEPLWEKLKPALHFACVPNDEERLVSIGRGLRHVLAVLLGESDRPLHMNEIVGKLQNRGHVNRNDYATQNMVRAAMREAGGLLYGRSVYGLEKHLPVSEEAAEEALTELEAIVLEGVSGRQWHCTELADELATRRPDLSEELDQFVVNVILTRSSIVRYLGRLVWVGAREKELLQDRLDVAAMCEAALLRSGRPLSKRELRDAIIEVRGLNHHFLPQASDRVVRLAHGLWGLADRDVGVSAENQKAALDALFRVLHTRQKGLHVTELFDALRGSDFTPDPELDEWELLGIAQSDERFRVGRGQLVGLASWDDVRRRSIGHAFAELQSRWQGPRTSEAMFADIDALTERTLPRVRIAAHAAGAGFMYDAVTGLWDLAPPMPEVEGSHGDEP